MNTNPVINHSHNLPVISGLNTSKGATPSVPSSILALEKYSISTSHMRFSLQNTPNIPAKMHHALAYYKILHWDSQYMKLAVHNGVILREGIRFNVIFSGCTRADCITSRSGQVLLSFRQAKPEYNLPAYVLIKPLKTRKQESENL